MDSTDFSVTVPDGLDGSRLDKAVVDLAGTFSRARIKKAIDGGAVRVNGRFRAKGSVVAAGDVITIASNASSPSEGPALAEAGAPLDVRFESEHVLVVSKPAGQATAPLRTDETGTLANALLGHFPELAGIGYSLREPGLVHRLDTDTSGVVVVARTREGFEELKMALKAEEIKKKYQLLCEGRNLPDTGVIAYPLANHPKDQKRVLACVHPRDVARNAPRPASTEYRVVARQGDLALVEVTVHRALRHQIRAHFAALGHPLVGDILYGGPSRPGLEHHALHASRVSYEGGKRVLAFDVEVPLRPAMQNLLD